MGEDFFNHDGTTARRRRRQFTTKNTKNTKGLAGQAWGLCELCCELLAARLFCGGVVVEKGFDDS
jgi:hypothetical protein